MGKQISEHAQAEYSEECCGIILSGNVVPDQSTEATQQEYVRTCRNIQNQRHADDPGTHPRDARTAYLMDPGDLLRIHKESEKENRPIKAFYHSHHKPQKRNKENTRKEERIIKKEN